MQQRILIVDDNSSIRNMLITAFENSGFEVYGATDGETGLAQATMGGYHAIITDLKMPKIDGLNLLKKIAELKPHTPNGPVIVFTSMDFDYARQEAKKLGAADFFIKDTLDPLEIVERVNHLIAQNSIPQTA
jgi:DNA-binding response OmpR family regulator